MNHLATKNEVETKLLFIEAQVKEMEKKLQQHISLLLKQQMNSIDYKNKALT